MLTSVVDTKQHEELILDREALCIQFESGNPFLPNQDYTFRRKCGEKETCEDVCRIPVREKHSDELSFFAEQSLAFAVKRAKRIPHNAQINNAVGLAYLKKGEIDTAIEWFRKALEIDKGHFAASANIARCHLAKGDLDAAIEVYLELGKNQPNDVHVLINLAIHLVLKKEYEEAKNYLKRAIKIDPRNVAALNNLGMLSLIQKDFRNAISTIRKALKNQTNDAGLYNNLGVCFAAMGSMKKATKQFSIAFSLNPNTKEVVLNLSQALQDLNQHEKVTALLEGYLDRYSKDVDLRNIIALSYFKIGNVKRCFKHLESALKECNEEDTHSISQLINNMGVVFNRLGHKDKSEECYIKSLELSKKGERIALFNLISLYWKTNQLEKAKTWIDRGLNEYPKEQHLLGLLGDYYYKKGHFSKAKQLYNQIIQNNPDFCGIYLSLSSLEIDANENYEEAVRILELALKKESKNPRLLNNYAYGLIMGNRLDEAREVMDRVKEGDDVFLNCTKGLLLIREGNLEEGRKFYGKAKHFAVEKGDKSLSVLVGQKKNLEIGRYLLENGKINQAKRHLKKGMTFRTNQPYYKRKIEKLLRQVKKMEKE